MATLLQVCLVLHITGIVLLGGTTLLNYIISKQFWACVSSDRNKALVINSTTLNFGRITAIGGVITILSGIAMVVVFHGIVASQLWFRIKMTLLLVIILNALLFARPQNNRLKKLLSVDHTKAGDLNAVKSKMDFYYTVQLLLFFSMFILSVFRFN